ncbi:MAG: hypothetical protein LBK60_00190 [Verrucomicrobiales bacterium]|jgi:hypothetical protein|nr:hypothetical protein [Verrucomicrobiales bacterium]
MQVKKYWLIIDGELMGGFDSQTAARQYQDRCRRNGRRWYQALITDDEKLKKKEGKDGI